MTIDDPSSRLACNFPCWASDGWDMACESSMQRADETTVGRARSAYARENGEAFTDVRVVLRHVHLWTFAECWDEYGRDDYRDRGWPATSRMPDEYQPGEDDPVWSFVARTHPGSIAYWVCFTRWDDGP